VRSDAVAILASRERAWDRQFLQERVGRQFLQEIECREIK
jgi:hypothetical protein